MQREPPQVVVTVPARSGAPAEVLSAGPPPAEGPPRASARVRRLALVGAAVLAAGLVAGVRTGDVPPPPPVAGTTGGAELAPGADDGLTASASLGAARTDARHVQRLTLTVVLEPHDGRGDSRGRLLGDEVVLLDVRVRGFSVVPDDRRTPIPLGRFGRANSGRATTVPLAATAVVADCAIEPLARREVLLRVRTGDGPVTLLAAVVGPDVVRALDRLVSRTCRRPRG